MTSGISFSGEMIGPVVVRAVGGERRQAVGVVPGADQVIGGGLAGRVGRVGLVGRGLGEFARRAQRAEHLVSRDVLEAEAGPRRLVERAPVGQRRFQERVGAGDVGLDEGGGAVDRAVDVAFRREMQHGIGPHFLEDRIERGAVADIDLEMAVSVAGAGFGQGVEVAGIGQLVDVGDRPVGVADDVTDDSGADESGAAGDEYLHAAAFRNGPITVNDARFGQGTIWSAHSSGWRRIPPARSVRRSRRNP